MEKIIIKEYDQLLIREKRDIKQKTITKDDAIALQGIIMGEEPVFKWGYKKLIAQHWVGNITLKNLSIEILPKLYGSVSEDDLRNVLTRMLLISHQRPSVREMPGMTQLCKNSLLEMLIDTFLTSLEKYTREGLTHSYRKVDINLSRVKGRILFNKQFSQNVLTPTKFWCRYSKFTADNNINQFFKLCLDQMSRNSTDAQNQSRIKYLIPVYEDFTYMSKEKALMHEMVFTSTNQSAEESYIYGKLFLNNIFSTLSAGNVPINMMLFDMNNLYELFIYKVAHLVYKNRAFYQMRGNYLLQRDSDSKKRTILRPDITIRQDNGSLAIIDTKWKIPLKFAKESDLYQMNAYSTSIDDIKEVILLYPLVKNERMVDNYHFIDKGGSKRPLKIRTIDLMQCLNWKKFLSDFPSILA